MPRGRTPTPRGEPPTFSPELAATYLAASVEIRWQGRWREAVELAATLQRSFAVITAWNPYSVPRSILRNAAANTLLYLALRRRGRVLRSVGSDARGASTWREVGFAVDLDDQEHLVELGRRFGQHAIFLVRPSGLELLACAA